jgi:hypothetical protein
MEYTIAQLRKLPPGARICFYRGPPFEHLSHRPYDYYQMMMELKDAVGELVASGRISVERIKMSKPPFDARYFATGL